MFTQLSTSDVYICLSVLLPGWHGLQLIGEGGLPSAAVITIQAFVFPHQFLFSPMEEEKVSDVRIPLPHRRAAGYFV